MHRPSLVFATAFVLLATLAPNAGAQVRTASPAQKEAIRALDFLVGEWSGGGWILQRSGERSTFTGTEVVQSKLDGTIILVEGRHLGKVAGQEAEVPVHQALGVFWYDEPAGLYRFTTYLADGSHQVSEGRIVDGNFVWGFPVEGQGVTLRFTIRLTESGAWHEIGEASVDGTTWNQFFEMTMERVPS